MGNFSLPYDHKINILFFLFLLISHWQKYFSITPLLSQLFIMYVLGIRYKEKWNKMAVASGKMQIYSGKKSNMCTISSMLRFVPGKVLRMRNGWNGILHHT